MALYPQTIPSGYDADAVTTSTKTTAAVGTAALKILSANPNRKGFTIFNNSGRTVFFDYDNTVTNTDFAFSMTNNSLYVDDLKWRGDVWAIATAANSNIRVRELAA
ncbi:MAG: hypothetical protein KME17_08140 [Cyanosarcina radialis HA8281-LM2]|jgi:hypothetical protein|nr:hypothetical protein [Cyanosarcina radialis HA8281-LM2]